MSRIGVPRARHLKHRSFFRALRQVTMLSFIAKETAKFENTATDIVGTVLEEIDTLSVAPGHGLVDREGPFLVNAETMPVNWPYAESQRFYVGMEAENVISLSLTRDWVLPVELEGFAQGDTLTLTREVSGGSLFGMLRRHKAETVAASTDIDNLK